MKRPSYLKLAQVIARHLSNKKNFNLPRAKAFHGRLARDRSTYPRLPLAKRSATSQSWAGMRQPSCAAHGQTDGWKTLLL